MKYTIRRYTRSDIPAMVNLVRQFMSHQVDGQSNYFAGLDFSEAKVYNLLNLNVTHPNFFCNVVVDEAGTIVGGLAGQLVTFVFSDDKVAKDLILFMSPEVKSVKLVVSLVTTFIMWAETAGAKEVQLCNSTGFKQDAFGALAKLLKMQQFEVGYSRRF